MPSPRAACLVFVTLLLALALAVCQAPLGQAASVSWPPSETIQIAEVMTGGVSASDEFVEVANVSNASADLNGLELVYATASGATVTRKASWAVSLQLAPGQRILVANVSGVFAPAADVTYSGGLAADGGALALRRAGQVVDAIGWGTATNSFVEGLAALAPPARSSIERRTGSSLLLQDTNDNAADWTVQTAPVPQGLGSASPAPSPSASSALPTSTADPTATTSQPAPTQSAVTTSTPNLTLPPATDAPTTDAPPTEAPATDVPPTDTPPTDLPPTNTPATDAPPTAMPPTDSPPTDAPATDTPPTDAPATASPGPTPSPTPSPTTTATAPAFTDPPSVPPPSATPVETTSPTAAATEPVSIVTARDAANGTHVVVEGQLTTGLGAIDSSRGAFVQDSTAGVSLWLPAAPAARIPAGTAIRVSGVVDDRYAQRTIRVDDDGIAIVAPGTQPEPIVILTGAAGEQLEGLRVAVSGTVTGPADQLADGTGLWVDDGTGPVRIVATPAALGSIQVGSGSRILAVGPLGQRLSATTAGYRIWVTEPGDLVVLDPIDPEPSDTPEPSATPVRTGTASMPPAPTASEVVPTDPPATPVVTPAEPSPTPSQIALPSPSATASGSGTPGLISIAQARRAPLKTRVRVSGVVTAPPGSLNSGAMIAIEDETGAIFVSLPAPLDSVEVGRQVTVAGRLAAPYGQLEIRELEMIETGEEVASPEPADVALRDIGEAVEAQLVSVEGRLTAVSLSGGKLAATMAEGSWSVRVAANAASGIGSPDLAKGDVVRVTGIVGQRASASGKLDGYRLWLRGPDDIEVVETAPGPSPTSRSSSRPPSGSSPTARPTPHPPLVRTIAQALGLPGELVQVEGTVSAPSGLMASGNETIVIQDTSGAIALLPPKGEAALRPGERVRVVGTVGRWHGGPRITATSLERLGLGTQLQPAEVASIGIAAEWRLVRISGTATTVTHLSDRWRVVVETPGGKVTVVAEPAAHIPSTGVVRGTRLSVTGIVRRSPSNPLAFQLAPRSTRDLVIVAAAADAGVARSPAASGRGSVAPNGPARTVPPIVEIADLPSFLGGSVTVSGLVTVIDGATAVDDGTASVILVDEAARDEVSLLEPGDAVAITGTVVTHGDTIGLRVDADGIVELAAPGASQDGSAADTFEPSSGRAAAALRDAAPAPPASGIAQSPVPLAVLLVSVAALVAAWRAGVRASIRRPWLRIVRRAEEDIAADRAPLVAATLDAQE